MNPQIEGIEALPGTYPFDVRTGVRTLRLNRFLWDLRQPAHRELFRKDEGTLMAQAGLTPEEQSLVRRRDWIGLVRYGVSFFVLEKFARTVGLSNLEVYASMRGEAFEAFMQTRKVPNAR